jgi:hypothetical protein
MAAGLSLSKRAACSIRFIGLIGLICSIGSVQTYQSNQ